MRLVRMLTGLLVAIAMAGGLPAAEVNVAAMREALLLPEEPAGAIPLAEARKQLGIAPQPIVVIGRIEAKGMDPFLEGKASFSLLELPADDHANKPGHKPDDCPFCKKRRANATMAAVQFLGPDDKPIPVDARTLFGVDKGRDVVVRGTGVFDAKLGIPVIQLTADGMFVRPK